MGLGKFIIGSVITTAVSATAEVAKEKSRAEKEIAHEKEITKRMELKNEKTLAKQQIAAQKIALKNNRQLAAQEAANQRAMLENQARANHFQELNNIRQARAQSPVLFSCPRCDGRRELDRLKGIISCPYCDFVEEIHPAHKYNPEIDGPLFTPPQQYNTSAMHQFPNNQVSATDGLKLFFNKYFK